MTARPSAVEPAGDDGLLAEPGTGFLEAPGEVHKTSFWTVAASKQSVLAFVKASRPAGSAFVGDGGGGGAGGPTTMYEEFAWPAVAHVLLTRQLVVEVASLADGRTGVRVDGEVTANVPSATAAISAQQTAAKAVFARVELAMARCVRAHGAPDFPDPNSHGVLPLARKGPLAQKENTAMGVCAHLLSHPRASLKIVGRVSTLVLRRFSACVRAHGLPGYPDLGADKKAAAAYVDKHLGELRRAVAACNELLPAIAH